jgi:S-adenosylmethionine:tRNA ribosyltransferase-isomerase
LDKAWYQTEWNKNSGSAASPTASLHFKSEDLESLKSRGVIVQTITLHVGMGTFLPIKTDSLSEHIMHSEYYEIPEETIAQIEIAKSKGRRIWALGTTVARSLESFAQTGKKSGDTKLFIQSGFEWRLTSGLLTNFHQPKTTLLALVAAFAGDLDLVKNIYNYAVENRFRLFSYGDLTVWTK